MKAVLGLAFLLVGFTVGWLVISGKISGLGASAGSSSGTAKEATLPNSAYIVNGNSNLGNITAQQINQRARNQNGPTGGGPTGIPTMASLADFGASQGAYA